ncbi:hypothetical protein F5876DRAFT_68893 [Lentinula aff. lateritia]|uniref:Uncharacterized protein n=1 Tax=Lentinula aff. lateritia TaxID=2804960 RepID=A0ACC1TP86_9AGAR|nr:hypothetical protein F5876DRAFT_68893 [Lentinula aff. lateritia]
MHRRTFELPQLFCHRPPVSPPRAPIQIQPNLMEFLTPFGQILSLMVKFNGPWHQSLNGILTFFGPLYSTSTSPSKKKKAAAAAAAKQKAEEETARKVAEEERAQAAAREERGKRMAEAAMARSRRGTSPGEVSASPRRPIVEIRRVKGKGKERVQAEAAGGDEEEDDEDDRAPCKQCRAKKNLLPDAGWQEKLYHL